MNAPSSNDIQAAAELLGMEPRDVHAEPSRCYQYLHTTGGTRRCTVEPDYHDGPHSYDSPLVPIGPVSPIIIRREPMPQSELVDLILRYEDGNITERDGLRLFAELITTGQAWSMQGAYGRMARDLIDGGYITRTGDLTGKTSTDL